MRTIVIIILIIILLLVVCLFLFSCAAINTVPIHDPLYPEPDEKMTFTVISESKDKIKKVSLNAKVYSVDDGGNHIEIDSVDIGKQNYETPLEEQVSSFVYNTGFPSKSFVKYSFKVKTKGFFNSRTHTVGFTVRPDATDTLDPRLPIEVYNQGDPDDIFDIVFIPDGDVGNSDSAFREFESNCRSMITSAVMSERTLKYFSRHFNFYINSYSFPGTAVTSSSICRHVKPSNWGNVSFAEAKALLHKETLDPDYNCEDKNLFSSEMADPKTLRHELGHTFDLYDEHPTGKHYEIEDLPNNWDRQADAHEAGESRHDRNDSPIDGLSWYKICLDNCIMHKTNRPFDYDLPCADRVIHVIKENIDVIEERRADGRIAAVEEGSAAIVQAEDSVITRLYARWNDYRLGRLSRKLDKMIRPFEHSYFIDDKNRHFAFKFKISNGKLSLTKPQPEIRPGNPPHSSPLSKSHRVSYKNSRGDEIGSRYIHNPLKLRACNAYRNGVPLGVLPRQSGTLEVLTPYDPEIRTLMIVGQKESFGPFTVKPCAVPELWKPPWVYGD